MIIGEPLVKNQVDVKPAIVYIESIIAPGKHKDFKGGGTASGKNRREEDIRATHKIIKRNAPLMVTSLSNKNRRLIPLNQLAIPLMLMIILALER